MAPTPMTAPFTRWIIFDGDNTLWDVEALYDEARTALCRLLAEGTTTVEEIERFQRARDHALHREMGYRTRFGRNTIGRLTEAATASATGTSGVRSCEKTINRF